MRFYDYDAAASFIVEATGIDEDVVRRVMDADYEYMKRIGIVDESRVPPSCLTGGREES